MKQRLILGVTWLAVIGAAGAALPEKVLVPWSFQPLKRPVVPKPANSEWPRDDVDRFVLSRLMTKGLGPSEDATRHVLIRRATLDLHGLLPTPEDVAAFERDPAPDDAAFAAVLDRLLQSPRFGERWARHWLDVARYADSVGRSWNAPFIQAWRYRDYVIDSFNADKPYSRFIAEQLAGDLLPARGDAEKQQNIIATGFLTLGSMDLTSGMAEMFRMDRLDDQIDVTTRAFLGLTMACARCHDHKTDPIKQHDYYALAGIFNSTTTWPGTAYKGDLGPNLYVDPERLFTLPSARGPAPLVPPAAQPFPVLPQGQVNAMDDMRTNSPGRAVEYEYDPKLAMAVSEGDMQNCPIRVKGDPYEQGKTPRRGDLEVPGLPALPKISAGESGRLQLAQWVATPTHPLTARVMANRIWAHLFGAGLVRTVDDFGITGEKPVNPALLDHLAVRFVETGWSFKKFIRALMLSRAYRQDSASNAQAAAIDPGNEMLWRMSPRRMEIEPLRDSLLQLSGDLSLERPAGIQVAGNGGKGNTGRTRSLLDIDSSCRTIYLPVLRDLLPGMHETWDFPNPSQIKGQREVTTVPSQALFLMNSPFTLRRAQAIAIRLLDDKALSGDEPRIAMAYRLLFSRAPDSEETKAAAGALEAMQPPSDEKDPELYRWTALVQALLGSAEFRYVL